MLCYQSDKMLYLKSLGSCCIWQVIFLFYLNIFVLYIGMTSILVLTSLSTHCIGHITTCSYMGKGNQFIQLVKALYCKLPTKGKQLPASPFQRPGFELLSQRCEARVLPLCHRGLYEYVCIHYILMILMIHQSATFFTVDEVNVIY